MFGEPWRPASGRPERERPRLAAETPSAKMGVDAKRSKDFNIKEKKYLG